MRALRQPPNVQLFQLPPALRNGDALAQVRHHAPKQEEYQRALRSAPNSEHERPDTMYSRSCVSALCPPPHSLQPRASTVRISFRKSSACANSLRWNRRVWAERQGQCAQQRPSTWRAISLVVPHLSLEPIIGSFLAFPRSLARSLARLLSSSLPHPPALVRALTISLGLSFCFSVPLLPSLTISLTPSQPPFSLSLAPPPLFLAQ